MLFAVEQMYKNSFRRIIYSDERNGQTSLDAHGSLEWVDFDVVEAHINSNETFGALPHHPA